MNFKEYLNEEKENAVSELRALVKDDKEAEKLKKNKTKYMDYVYTKYEKEVEAIRKKYNYGFDQFFNVLKKM